MNIGDAAILFAAAAWAISLVVAVKVVPVLAAKRICEQFGLQKVNVNGRDIYAVEDLEGNPVKIPIGTKQNAEGEPEVVYGYAPLPMTLTYLAAEQAAIKVKMTLFNAKSQISKKLSKEALGQAMQEGGSLDAMLPFLPKKAQMAAALLRAVGVGNASSAQNRPEGAPRGGGKAL